MIAMSFLFLGGLGYTGQAPLATGSLGSAALEAAAGEWIADEEDNICGISDLKKVTNPAKVSYDRLLDATPQMQELKRKGIDSDSAEGKALRKGAKTLITKTCELVRAARGHCSVWRSIGNKDGRAIPDITDEVIEKF
jgi:hypothetical protein